MKHFSLSMLLTLLLSMMGINAFAYDIAVENADGVTIFYDFINNGTELRVTDNKTASSEPYSGSIVIPEEVTYMNETRKVTSIGYRAFYESSITSVTIPNSVTSFGGEAFRYCNYLTSVNISDLAAWCNNSFPDFYSNPLKCGHHLFLNGEEVKNLVVPNNVTAIGKGAFLGCSGLTSVTIGDNVTSLGDNAFRECSNLTSVIIGDNVTSIGHYAFRECSGLTSVTIGNSVTSIGYDAFYNCRSLTTINIPNSVTFIENDAFNGCSSLTSITIPNGVTSIGESTFQGCSALTSITIPNSVTSIGNSAFFACSDLTSITIPNSVTSIGNHAFESCGGLTSVTIPNSVTFIGNNAFCRCVRLTSITIPNSVTSSIGERTFYGCRSLTSVTIGNSVASIGYEAFYGCRSLTSIISKMKNPCPIYGSNSFTQDIYSNTILYVPQGTKANYERKAYWKNFVHIEELGIPEPEPQTCSKPTIGYKKGQLTFDCATEGATCCYSITDSDIKSGNGDKVDLTVTYQISVYATKQGYYDSDVATATLCWIDVDPKTEGIENGVANVKAMPVLIQSEGGVLHITGAPEGVNISVYNTGGQMVGSAKASTDITTVSTTLQNGEIGIVKIGDKAVKVLVK